MSEKFFPENSEKFRFIKKPVPLLTFENTLAIYTILSILISMRRQLGLESMLEYMIAYLTLIEKSNPFIKEAVQEALNLIKISKLYEDITRNDPTDGM